MDEERYQKELFEFEKPKRQFLRLSNIFPKADLDNRVAITLTLERLILITIGLIMLMVVIYALGVESGKRFTKAAVSETRISLAKAPVVSPVPGPAAIPAPAPAARQNGLPVKGPYTVLAASFRHKDYAMLAVKKMKGAGFDAYLIQSGGMHRLCVGAYTSDSDAQKELLRVKRVYKDAYIKTKQN